MHTHLLATTGTEYSEEPCQGVKEAIHYTFLQGNDGIVGDGDAFRTYLGATFCNVAKPDAVLLAKGGDTIRLVYRVHFQSRCINQKTRADELIVQVMFAQNMADVLAKEALNAFAELLNTVGVLLGHAPGAVG